MQVVARAPLGASELAGHAAFVQQHDTVAQPFDGFRDVAREQDRTAGLRQPAQLALGRERRGSVETLERLVAQQHARRVQDGGEERELLAHAV